MKEQLIQLIKKHGMTRALIIDDAYDAPTVRTVSSNFQAFKDGLRSDQDYKKVFELLQDPTATEERLDELLEKDRIIQILFDGHHQIPDKAYDGLFSDFIDQRLANQAELDPINAVLEDLGLEVQKHGAELKGDPTTADIVLVDLFFRDITLEDAAKDAAERLSKHIDHNAQPSPLTILISTRVPELETINQQFRESAQVAGCRFAFLPKGVFKTALNEAHYKLYQLIDHHPSSLEFDLIISQLASAADIARDRFMEQLRRFELSDFADLQDLVVKAEGVPLSQYLLDLYAQSWVSIAEADRSLIESFQELEGLDLSVENYPPNAFAPSEAVLDIYEQALYRPLSALPELTMFSDLSLGDILQSVEEGKDGQPLYLVIAQDCDMIRNKPDAVFLIPGKLQGRPLVRRHNEGVLPFTYKGQRYSVEWDEKQWQALKGDDTFSAFIKEHQLERVARLRSPWSLSYQTSFFQYLARPAEMALPHEIHPVDLQVMLTNSKNQAIAILDFSEAEQGYLLAGRASKKSVTRLVFSDQTFTSLREALREAISRDGACCDGAREWGELLLGDAEKLNALRARLIVSQSGNKQREDQPLDATATATDEGKYWQGGQNPGHGIYLVVNIKRLNDPTSENNE